MQTRLVVSKTIERPVPIPRDYGDRFIPRRYTNMSDFLCKQYNQHIPNKEEECIDIIRLREKNGYWRAKTYTESLKIALAIKEERIYMLSDPYLKSSIERFYNLDRNSASIERTHPNTQEFDWPCCPRVRPMAYPDSTHDLPGFRSNFGPNILSWSSRGPIAASFRNDLVLWTPDTLNTLIYKISESLAISYNPDGNVLAVSCKKAGSVALQLWDCSEQNFIYYMKEYRSSNTSDQIECIDWEPTGKYIACGTINGSVLIFRARSLKIVHILRRDKVKIYTVRFSPKMIYLAANDMSGRTSIWSWDSCALHCRINEKSLFNSNMDWHPWNGTDLAIASSSPAAIYIYNVPSKSIVAYYKRQDDLVFIETLFFNKISAELLISCTIKSSEENPQHEVLVLASLDRIVDVMRSHEDTISFLVWNPNGMQLATASDDDVLYIWNFFALKDSKRRCPYKCNTKLKKIEDDDHRFKLFKFIR